MDIALPYIFPSIKNKNIETKKFINFLSALHSRRNLNLNVHHTPIDATIDFTTTCQLKCPYCAVGNGSIERNISLMKQEKYQQIMNNIGDEVFIIWYFNTGEPLLHKRFEQIITQYKQKEIFSTISTNLSIPLSNERIDQLVQSGLSVISVSLDGATKSSYLKYRIGGEFDLVIDNINRLVNRKKELGLIFPIIEWRFLRFRHNQDEEDLARSMAKSIGVDLIEFFPGSAPNSANDDTVQLADKPLVGPPIEGPLIGNTMNNPRGLLDKYLQNEQYLYGLPAAKTNERKCDWLYFGTMIYPDGSVGPCCASNNKKDDFAFFPTIKHFLKFITKIRS